MSSYTEMKTNINGATIFLNKVVADERGYFLDLAEIDNPAMKNLKHVHAAIANGKHKSRGEHYHMRLEENFYTIGGSSLCILYDFDENSSTKGEVFAFIAGNKIETPKNDKIPSFFIEDNILAQVRVKPYIWHAWWALSDNPAFIVAFGTEGYDSLDYKKPAAFSIPKVARVLSDYGIK